MHQFKLNVDVTRNGELFHASTVYGGENYHASGVTPGRALCALGKKIDR